ncbi:helix-turn-helix transcriptional regulator [Bradyrhizobium sp. 197]|jgi:transcriptional regulator with XRE-family HTH domain|uniref:helix-turn-helix domain-containing protein n=1 Tax=Bradyrhizobium sp. 197 TaxID=2782663 RepID=UPI0021115032|nr:helix-turn-helix transcriptional regulator [Bradyrhizobium sp. 197]
MDQQKRDRAIGRRLKPLRTQAGMTLNELAARSGVSQSSTCRPARGCRTARGDAMPSQLQDARYVIITRRGASYGKM